MRNGLKENESNANKKLFLVARYLIENTTYKPSVIKKNLKKYAAKYFEGLSDDIIDNEIEWIFNGANNVKNLVEESGGTDDPENISEELEIDNVETRKYFDLKDLTLYKSEMKCINELDEELQELAFAFLIVLLPELSSIQGLEVLLRDLTSLLRLIVLMLKMETVLSQKMVSLVTGTVSFL